jgi:hypothetical protein
VTAVADLFAFGVYAVTSTLATNEGRLYVALVTCTVIGALWIVLTAGRAVRWAAAAVWRAVTRTPRPLSEVELLRVEYADLRQELTATATTLGLRTGQRDAAQDELKAVRAELAALRAARPPADVDPDAVTQEIPLQPSAPHGLESAHA